MKVDGRLEVLPVSEAVGHFLDGLDLRVEALADGVGDAVGEEVELTRFRGHPMVGVERSLHDAEESSAVPDGVPAAHHRTGAEGTDPRRTGVELTRFCGHPYGWDGKENVHDAEEPYSAEFKQRIIELVRKGRTPEELGRQFEPSAQAIRNWVRQAHRDEGHRKDGLTTAEQEELRRLRRENRALREEREILKNAAAWFARETSSIRSKDSSS